MKKESSSEFEVNEIDSLKKYFTPVFKGTWVLTDYIEAIEQTKSPLKASDKLQDVVSMVIDTPLNSDSVEVGASRNNHEGYSFMVYFVKGQNQRSLKTNIPDDDQSSNFFELGYELSRKDTFLILYHYDKNKKLLDRKRFTKVFETIAEGDLGDAIQFIVNEKVLAGKYFIIDSTNSKTEIILKNDGSFMGYSDFKTYYVLTDLMGGPVTIIDQVVINSGEKNSKLFAFKMSKDTTYFYTTTGTEEAGEVLQLDKIKYKLVRR